MKWKNISCEKKGIIIGASICIIFFIIFHVPEAVFLDKFFSGSGEETLESESHIIFIIFIMAIIYCSFVGFLLGKLIKKTKACK